jgi:esterase/lipase superfamily enzyme
MAPSRPPTKQIFHKSGETKVAPWELPSFWKFQHDKVSVRVYYGTNRARTGSLLPHEFYGDRRDETSMSYGWCEVSIPLGSRERGEIPRPRFRFLESEDRHVVLQDVEPLERDQLYALLRQSLGAERSDAMLIFVHGFKTTFEDAALRTAQIALDLQFQGPAMFFSWPSGGRTAAYVGDKQSAVWARAGLRDFLRDAALRTEAKSIYVIAHSMGNELMPGAYLDVIAANPELRPRFRELILAAPDIDAAVFKRDIAPVLVQSKINVTLYVSDKDAALYASKRAHSDYPRAGDMAGGPIVLAGIETIDASQVETDFTFEHSYFGDSESVLSDIRYLIQGLRASQRDLLRKAHPDGQYWQIQSKGRLKTYISIGLGGLVAGVVLFLVVGLILRKLRAR